ncbi:MAG: hypothetical protein V7785_24685 [Bermanella sp.]
MYIIRHKFTLQILHTLSAKLTLNLTGPQVYSAYDPGTMELLKSKNDSFPDVFNVDENGYIQEKTLQQKLLADEVDFAQIFNPEQLGPSSSDEENKGIQDLIDFVVEQNLIDSQYKADIVFGYLVDNFEKNLQEKYSQGMELKLLKGYMDWQDERKPRNDIRQRKYLKMKEDVEAIKAIHKPMMNRVKQVMAELGS